MFGTDSDLLVVVLFAEVIATVIHFDVAVRVEIPLIEFAVVRGEVRTETSDTKADIGTVALEFTSAYTPPCTLQMARMAFDVDHLPCQNRLLHLRR